MKLDIKQEDNIFKVVGGGLTTYKVFIAGGLVGNPEGEMMCRGFSFDNSVWLIEKDFKDGFNSFIKENSCGHWIRKYGLVTSSQIIRMQSVRRVIHKDCSYNVTAVKQGISEFSKFPQGNFNCIQFSSARAIADIYDGLTLRLEKSVQNSPIKQIDEKNEKEDTVSSYTRNDFISSELKDENLIELFIGYLEIRKQKRLPTTDLTIKLLIERLREVSGNKTDLACKVVTQAILKGWKTFYPVKY